MPYRMAILIRLVVFPLPDGPTNANVRLSSGFSGENVRSRYSRREFAQQHHSQYPCTRRCPASRRRDQTRRICLHPGLAQRLHRIVHAVRNSSAIDADLRPRPPDAPSQPATPTFRDVYRPTRISPERVFACRSRIPQSCERGQSDEGPNDPRFHSPICHSHPMQTSLPAVQTAAQRRAPAGNQPAKRLLPVPDAPHPSRPAHCWQSKSWFPYGLFSPDSCMPLLNDSE